MKVASACNAETFNVRPCFFVNVRNASGLSVGGGSNMGKIGLLTAGLNAGGANGRCAAAGRIGCAGVPNAGDEEKMFTSEGFRIESMMLSAVVSLRP